MPIKAPVKHLMNKGGMFTFSCERNQLADALLTQIETLYSTVRRMPMLPEIAQKLEVDLTRRSIFGTAAIEGNPLTENEVGELIDNGSVQESGDATTDKQRAQKEIRNLKQAYAAFVPRAVATESPLLLTEDSIRDLHRTLTQGLGYYHNSPGNYRNEIVKVGDANHGGVYTPPRTLDDIATLMGMFVELVNNANWFENIKSEHRPVSAAIIRSAFAHYYIAKIHPFQDGNGRTARLVESIILTGSGVRFIGPMLSNYYYQHLDAYFIAFSQARKANSFAPFLEFVAAGAVECLQEIHGTLADYTAHQLIKSHIMNCLERKSISRRQHDLLLILHKTGQAFSLSSLYSDPILKPLYTPVSESTARRDIRHLLELGFIVPQGDRYALDRDMLFT